ncbi:MAG TPA: carboxypeptidase-like regulatory domain-containing protein, partial [Lacipirellulaceae bacterium]|nr:carboxypeptidase-like regulatory domain-containing protein [Lacipirellulaceae bacterium]
RPAATIRGRVTSPDNKPVKDALVWVQNDGTVAWDVARSTHTDADGQYEITDAPPFDLAKYKRTLEEEARARVEKRSSDAQQVSAFEAPLGLSVSHPDFVTFYTQIENSPGTQDVQLAAPVIIIGRVILKSSGKPAAGAVVTATRQTPAKLPPGETSLHQLYRTTATTDAEGKYRIATLPAGIYALQANMPGLQNLSATKVSTADVHTLDSPDLELGNGGLVRARMIDRATGKPIELGPDMKAFLAAGSPFQQSAVPGVTKYVDRSPDGRFELRVPPGQINLVAFAIDVDGVPKWFGSNENRPTVTVADDETVDVDLPVSSEKSQPTSNLEVRPASR